MNRLRHCLPEVLPDGWDWPARPSSSGYWVLTYNYGSRLNNRALHLCVAEVEGIPDVGCWWCGRTTGVVWNVDHVDGDRENNLPYNLVRVCAGCNLHKGSEWRGPGYMTRAQYEKSGQGVHVCVDRRMCALGITPCCI